MGKESKSKYISQLTDEELMEIFNKITASKTRKVINFAGIERFDSYITMKYTTKDINRYISVADRVLTLEDFNVNAMHRTIFFNYMVNRFGMEYVDDLNAYVDENIDNPELADSLKTSKSIIDKIMAKLSTSVKA